MLTPLPLQASIQPSIRVSIRAAVPDDAAMLTRLAAQTFHDAFSETNSPENMKAYMSEAFTLERISSDLADPKAKILIVEVESLPTEKPLIGYANLYDGEVPNCVRGRPAIEIKRFYLDQRFHGAGVAHSLMQACLEEAARAGAQTIFLGVWERNPRAQAFYRKWEFETVGSHPFQMGDELQTDLWMQRKI